MVALADSVLAPDYQLRLEQITPLQLAQEARVSNLPVLTAAIACFLLLHPPEAAVAVLRMLRLLLLILVVLAVALEITTALARRVTGTHQTLHQVKEITAAHLGQVLLILVLEEEAARLR